MHTGRFQQIAQWTTNIAHLGAGRFAQLEFPLPSLLEQKEIVKRVNELLRNINSFKGLYLAMDISLSKLDQSILAKTFRGELVPQDPNDEPAAVLLNRIRAEREKIDSKFKRQSSKGKQGKRMRGWQGDGRRNDGSVSPTQCVENASPVQSG